MRSLSQDSRCCMQGAQLKQYLNRGMSATSKYDTIIGGKYQHLSKQEMLEFKDYCSRQSLSLDKWIEITLTFYKIDPTLCLQLLIYIEKHQLNRPIYRDFNKSPKIAIYNNLAAMHLEKAIHQPNKEERDKCMRQVNTYLNNSEKINGFPGKTHLVMRGFIKFYDGGFETANSNFSTSIEKSSDQDGQSVMGVLGLAQLSFAKRNYEAALSNYKKALRMNRSLPTRARLGMAYCFYELQKYELALACFKRILDLDPNFIEARIGYGVVNFNMGNKAVYFQQLEDCYRLNPNHPLVLLHLAQHLLLSGNLSKLQAVCQKGLQSLKNFPILIDNSNNYRNDLIEYRCRLNHILGQLYHINSEHQTCQKYYNLALNQNLLFVHLNLAQTYTNPSIPMYEQAFNLLTTVHNSINPKYRKLLNQTFRLQAYVKSKLYHARPQAIELYSQAIKHNSRDFEALIEYANLLIDSDFNKCLLLFQSAYDVLSKNGEFLQPEIFNNLAVMYVANQRYAEAQRFFTLAFEQTAVWKQNTKEEEALRIIKEKAFEAFLRFNRGIMYEDTQQYQDAIAEYKKALEVNPYIVDVYVRLALLSQSKGNFKHAIQYCDTASKLISDCRLLHRQNQTIDVVKAYLLKTVGDERSAKAVISRHRQKDGYARVLDESLDFDILIQKTDSNTLNIRDALKIKANAVLRACQNDKYNMYEVMILGVLMAELGNYRQASECFQQIKQFDDEHPQIMFNMAVLYYRMERYGDAVLTIKRYLEKVGRTLDFRGELALSVMLFAQNKSQQAIRVLKRLILIHPSNLMLRYNLHMFLQRYSQTNLDQKNKQTKLTKDSIGYLKRCYSFFNHCSRLPVHEYLITAQNMEAKEKLKLQLSHIAQKSQDQKLYIKSREERFTAYVNQAQIRQSATNQASLKIMARVQQKFEMKRRRQEQENRRQAELAEQKRKAMIQQQRQIQLQLNAQVMMDQEERRKQNTKKVPARKRRRSKQVIQEERHKQIDDKDLVPAVPTKLNRLTRISDNSSEESSEDKYNRQEGGNPAPEGGQGDSNSPNYGGAEEGNNKIQPEGDDM